MRGECKSQKMAPPTSLLEKPVRGTMNIPFRHSEKSSCSTAKVELKWELVENGSRSPEVVSASVGL